MQRRLHKWLKEELLRLYGSRACSSSSPQQLLQDSGECACGTSTFCTGPRGGVYSIEQLGVDVLALLDALGISNASFCGLSMGGLIGQWLAINAPDRIKNLVLCNTAAKIGTPEVWKPRIDAVLSGGSQAMRNLRDASISRWFTADFASVEPTKVDPVVGMLAQTSSVGYAANCAAVRDADFRDQLGAIRARTLIVCGSSDPVTTTEDGRFMQEHITGAQLAKLDAAHLSNVQAGESFNQRVLAFLV